MGVVIMYRCCCKEVYRFPRTITYPYSTCISSFFCSSIPTSLFINPRRAARVTVVVLCVRMYVCPLISAA